MQSEELNPEVMVSILRDSTDRLLERKLGPYIELVGQIEVAKHRECVTPDEVERVYGLNSGSLCNKRHKKQGPDYIKFGKKVLYRNRTINSYLDTHTVKTKE